jgi:hypothetical protein
MEAARRGDGTLRHREERMRNSEVEADGLPKMKYTRALIGRPYPYKHVTRNQLYIKALCML